MIGYKSFDSGLKDQYGNPYKLGQIYSINELPTWGKCGFHFCSRPEDTLRYAKDKNNFSIYEVEGSGEIQVYNDEYYGYYDMYVCNMISILRNVPRDEVIKSIVESKDESRITRLISLTMLSKEEIEYIFDSCKKDVIDSYIRYYQYNDTDVFKRKLKKMN